MIRVFVLVVLALVCAVGEGCAAANGSNRASLSNDATYDGGPIYVGGPITGWRGPDIGAQINSAYRALPPSGGKIVVLPQFSGACYDFSTPITATTPGKYLILEGGSAIGIDAGACLNYKPASGTAITIDVSPADKGSGGTGAGAGGEWTPGGGIRDLEIENNGCITTGGCGGTAIGLALGGVNYGAHRGEFHNLKIQGFSTAIKQLSGLSWGMVFINCSLDFNGVSFASDVGAENVSFFGGTITNNGTGLLLTNSGSPVTGDEIHSYGVSYDDNSVLAVSLGGSSSFHSYGDHFENFEGGTSHFIMSSQYATIYMFGGEMADDVTSGNIDWWIQAGGLGLTVQDTQLFSQGRTATAIAQINSPVRAKVAFANGDPMHLTTMTSGTSKEVTDLSININGGASPTAKFEKAVQASHYQVAPGLGASPTCVTTGAGSLSSCSTNSGSSDSSGTVIITDGGAGIAATGVLTVTFDSQLGPQSSSCVATLNNAGNSWNPRATIFQISTSPTEPTFNWDNNAATLVPGTWFINYWCVGM